MRKFIYKMIIYAKIQTARGLSQLYVKSDLQHWFLAIVANDLLIIRMKEYM